MFVELHILQNFAPSNLNRDDTGAPKDCEFGGYRRARVSSQCLKRAIRDQFRREKLIPDERLARRTKRLVEAVARRLIERDGQRAEETARSVVETALGGVDLKVADEHKTQYLLFLGESEIERIAALCHEHWDTLVAVTRPSEPAPSAGGRPSARDAKKASREAAPEDVKKGLRGVLDGGKAVDLALFGRMLADLPEHNRDAASQVAHAISTHRASMEIDFYTAVDDLKPDDTAGADMLGTVEFNSACFYRYANVDLGQLQRNLDGDAELVREALRAFLRASVLAVPTGKQNSMAAQNPPSFVFAVVRERGLWNLANAFVQPVRAGADGDLVERSIRALDAYWGKLMRMYAPKGITGQWVCTLEEAALGELAPAKTHTFDELVAKVEAAAFASDNGSANP